MNIYIEKHHMVIGVIVVAAIIGAYVYYHQQPTHHGTSTSIPGVSFPQMFMPWGRINPMQAVPTEQATDNPYGL